ncbi:MAG TPA: conjugal transfer protein TraR [Moorella mulderi]|nr:conjugal transfer protein TraR [Moorella mulderi]
MEPEEVRRFQKMLLQRKRELEESLRFLEEQMRTPLVESLQELSLYDNHPADVGSETFERGKDLALLNSLVLDLERVKAALDRIGEGSYGYCACCGREIPRARLEVLPEADLCQDCARKGTETARRRPVEEQVVGPPFGEFFPGRERVIYDGQDIWQELAHTAEHTLQSESGSYYGPLDLEEEGKWGEKVEAIPHYKDNGIYCKDPGVEDDQEPRPL